MFSFDGDEQWRPVWFNETFSSRYEIGKIFSWLTKVNNLNNWKNSNP